jgi:hypothetical protein
MTDEPADSQVPPDWDRLQDSRHDAVTATYEIDVEDELHTPPVVAMVGSAWGDLVTVLGVCTAALIALAMLGYRTEIATFPWALGLGVAWWGAAAAVLLVVRAGTPGMLMAGVAFASGVPRPRIPWVLITALVQLCTLGVPALLGATRSPLRLAAGVSVVATRSRHTDSR